MTPWFIKYPNHYQRELAAFNDLGVDVTEDDDLRKKSEIIRWTLTIQGSNPNFDIDDKTRDYTLIIVFPDSYPWFRPQVYAYDLDLPRHQHLLGKNLCLLPRSTRFWYPEQTIADLLKTQLSLVLKKGSVTDFAEVKNDPDEQAEPASDYYFYWHNISVLFDPTEIGVQKVYNDFEVIGKAEFGFPEDAPMPARIAVKAVHIKGQNNISTLPKALALYFPKNLSGVLIRSSQRPPIGNDDKTGNGTLVYDWLKKGLGVQAKVLEGTSKLSFRAGTYYNVIGINFPDETIKGEEGTSWIFLVRGAMTPQDGMKKREVAFLAKASYISKEATKDRVPKLIPLNTKSVAVFGLGALGSFTTIELARSGIKELRLMDFDTIDPPTTVRWPLGLTAAGLPKTSVLKKFIQENYPFTAVRIESWRIGDLRIEGRNISPYESRSEWQILEDFLSDVDMIIDATAEEGVNNFLSRQSYQLGIPYLSMYTTPGALGGVIMRYIPGLTGCWSCMKEWQKSDPENLVPPSDDNGEIQPPGCSDMTFTGAGFDLQNIVLAGVRLAVSTLCRGENGYPDFDWDWAVLKLKDDHRLAIAPQWTTQPLNINPNCPYNGYH